MSKYKDKLKSFREMAEKLGVCGHTMMADDYRWAADTIEELLKRNEVQSLIIKDKLSVITTMTTHLHEVKSKLQKVIKRLHEVESERDAAIAGQETLQKELARVMEGK